MKQFALSKVFLHGNALKKMLRVMKLTCLFVLLAMMQVSANVYAQQKLFTLDLKDATVTDLMKRIKNQSDFDFVYALETVDNVSVKDAKFINQKVDKILAECLKGTKITYKIDDKVIVLMPAKVKIQQQQQQKKHTVTGKVTDEKGNPLPGVSVVIKGSYNGVATDENGSYTISAKATDVLIVSFVGMEKQEIAINKRELVNVVMKEKANKLDDVVVTGYANISKKSFTGNVKQMDQSQIKRISSTNIFKAIQALDPSFQIMEDNEIGANPNSTPKIRLRGSSSLGISGLASKDISRANLQSDPNLPTFIMDGFEINVQKLFDMDINRIKSITLLKDAAATAIYGSKAANGVVVITTVTPKPGELMVSYNYDLSLSLPDISDYNMMKGREKIEAEKEAGIFKDLSLDHYYDELNAIAKGQRTDWLSLPLRNAVSHKHSIRLEGGAKSLRYGISYNNYTQKGVMKGSNRDRQGISLDLQYYTKKLRFKNSIDYTSVKSTESPYGSYSDYTNIPDYVPYLGADHLPLVKAKYGIFYSPENPMYEAMIGNFTENKTKGFTNNFNIKYNITDYLYLEGKIALTYERRTYEKYLSEKSQSTTSLKDEEKGQLTKFNQDKSVLDGGIHLYFNKKINNHYVNFLAGVDVVDSNIENEGYTVMGLPGGFSRPQYALKFKNAPNALLDRNRNVGYILSGNYTYKNIYLFDGTLRVDGNSSFGSDSRFATFWSVGTGVNLHKLSFLKDVIWLNMLKVRASYGITGKADFPASTAVTTYTFNQRYVLPQGIPATINKMGNPNLKWERTKITDFGLELALLKNRLTFDISYYHKNTIDLIADMTVSSSSGFTSYKENIGEILNKGIESTIRVKAISKDDVQLFVGASISANSNRITKLSEAMEAYNKKVDDDFNNTRIENRDEKPLVKFYTGASVSAIYAMKSLGIDPMTGKELFQHRDGTVDTKWIAAENQALGDTEPDYRGTFFINMIVKGITLDAYCTFKAGGQVYNQTLQDKIENRDVRYNLDKRFLTGRWRKVGDIKPFKSIKDYRLRTSPTSRFIQDEDVFELRTLSLGYDVPKKMLARTFLNNLRFSANMNNVFRLSTVKMERGLSYPFARNFTFSVVLGF